MMNEFVGESCVVRVIRHRSLLAAVGKALHYLVVYPSDRFNTKLVHAEFERGVYHLRLSRDRY